MNKNDTHLTSAEIACLWNSYINNSMSKCILDFMLKHIEDKDIKLVVEYAYDIATHHLDQLLGIFEQDDYAIPQGFSKEDVNMEAPWLFSDTFCLTYVNHMSKVGMLTCGGYVGMSKRKDLRNLYTQMLADTSTLYNQTTEIAASKEILAKDPFIEVPKNTDYVSSKAYFSGLNPLKSKRPLNAVEISYLFMNTLTNTIGGKLCLAFAQTSPSKEIQDYMLRGRDISNKHVQVFLETLLDNDIPNLGIPELFVSDSTTKTFSDRLLMFHISLLSASGTGNYATAAAASQRSDLVLDYERLSLEIGQYAKSGADIMIKHNWLEQPPGPKDREKLARKKGEE
ncbi:hypothetical protein HNR44_002747 [Geomicrobium halophilum]|uniref:DUF3231 family protein n=1 Tax=Geomicrobium halophilum TaxID=549000 RepID=A0A841PPK1_9BACL|nr:DUF3231 family protein [Geomicrobium halophilum]MBB6450757.1 hypothetical protein [Geomicrobium halophilum]